MTGARRPPEGRVLVTGATGNVGAPLAAALRAAGADVVAAARSEGTDTVRFDFTDPATWPAALEDVDRVFLVRPPALSDVTTHLRPLISELERRAVRHVVFLSVMGVNPAMPHWRVERDLRATSLGWTMLRPAFFMQNLSGPYGDDIRRHDRITQPAGRGAFSFVDADDLAEVAARILTDPEPHRGAAPTLTGPEALRYDEVASLLSAELGRPIVHEPDPLLAHRRKLLAAGAPSAYVNVQLVINVTARWGLAARLTPDLERLLGRPPTRLADFVAAHRGAFERVPR